MCCILLSILGGYLLIGLISAFLILGFVERQLQELQDDPKNKAIALLVITLFWPGFLYETLTKKGAS